LETKTINLKGQTILTITSGFHLSFCKYKGLITLLAFSVAVAASPIRISVTPQPGNWMHMLINQAIDSLPPEGGTVYLPAGFYQVGYSYAGAINIINRQNIT